MARFVLILLLGLVYVVVAVKGHDEGMHEFDESYDEPKTQFEDNTVHDDLDSGKLKISGGSEASITKFPFQAALIANGSVICGGCIISKSWILTAAHCVYRLNVSALTIRVGSVSYNSSGEVYNVTTIEVHSLFNSTTLDYDFGLVKLNTNLTFGSTINYANIPSETSNLPLVGPLYVPGWGSTTTGGAYSSILQFIKVLVLPRFICGMIYSGAPLFSDRMFCAGFIFTTKTPCEGDSGGPAVFQNVVVGVVSFGSSICGDRLKPTMFAKVRTAVGWINGITGIA